MAAATKTATEGLTSRPPSEGTCASQLSRIQCEAGHELCPVRRTLSIVPAFVVDLHGPPLDQRI